MNNQPHRPEYVILEPEETPRSESEELFGKIKGLSTKKFPFSVRLSVFFALLLMVPVTAIILLFLVVSGALSSLTLFQVKGFNTQLKKTWKMVLNSLVVMLGFFLAIFSPPFGFSVIMLYFLLYSDQQRDLFIQRFYKRF